MSGGAPCRCYLFGVEPAENQDRENQEEKSPSEFEEHEHKVLFSNNRVFGFRVDKEMGDDEAEEGTERVQEAEDGEVDRGSFG